MDSDSSQTEAALLLWLDPNYAIRADPNLYRIAVGQHHRRRSCLFIIRARQGVLIENVALWREPRRATRPYWLLPHVGELSEAAVRVWGWETSWRLHCAIFRLPQQGVFLRSSLASNDAV